MPGTRKLGRATSHRIAMLRGMVTFLFENGIDGAKKERGVGRVYSVP